jgi:hypothetical protein
MRKRVNIIACALALGAVTASAAQAADQRSPDSGNQSAGVTRLNALANLGHEGSGLLARERRVHRKAAQPFYNVFAGLGHEGSGTVAAGEAVAMRPWAN